MIHNCLTCRERFMSKMELNRHTRFHHVILVVRCAKCGELFPSTRSRSAHMMRHDAVTYNPHPEEPIPPERLQCFYCPSVFATQEDCDNHEIERHWHLTGGDFSWRNIGNGLCMHKFYLGIWYFLFIIVYDFLFLFLGIYIIYVGFYFILFLC